MEAFDAATIRRVISAIDLTDLSDDHAAGGIEELLDNARRHRTAAVCVWPEFVAHATGVLEGSGVSVATVANFPGGEAPMTSVLGDVGRSLDAGADEIDVVLPYRRLLAGQASEAADLVEAVGAAVHEAGALLKVILETGELVEREQVVAAAELAVDAGADFIKTSTGKTLVGATTEAVDAMIDVIAAADRPIGLKPSGGISTVERATELIDLVERRLGVDATTPDRFRLGASSLLADAVRALDDAV